MKTALPVMPMSLMDSTGSLMLGSHLISPACSLPRDCDQFRVPNPMLNLHKNGDDQESNQSVTITNLTPNHCMTMTYNIRLLLTYKHGMKRIRDREIIFIL